MRLLSIPCETDSRAKESLSPRLGTQETRKPPIMHRITPRPSTKAVQVESATRGPVIPVIWGFNIQNAICSCKRARAAGLPKSSNAIMRTTRSLSIPCEVPMREGDDWGMVCNVSSCLAVWLFHRKEWYCPERRLPENQRNVDLKEH